MAKLGKVKHLAAGETPRQVLFWLVLLALFATIPNHSAAQTATTVTFSATETVSIGYYNRNIAYLRPVDGYRELFFGNHTASTATLAMFGFAYDTTEVVADRVYLRGYLRFGDISLPTNAEIHHAVLRLYVTDCAPGTPTSPTMTMTAGVYPTTLDWRETTAFAWETSPLTLHAAQEITRGDYRWYEWDITTDAATLVDQAQRGWVISSAPDLDTPAGLVCRAANRAAVEPALAPLMVITYIQPSAPTVTPNAQESTRSVPAEVPEAGTLILLVSGGGILIGIWKKGLW